LTDWPVSPTYLFTPQQIFSGTPPTTATILNCSAFVPKNAKSALFNGWSYGSSVMYYLADNFAYANQGQVAIYTVSGTCCNLAVSCTLNQSIQHFAASSSASIWLAIRGYIATESV
jgi:hypothetical protein